MSIIRLTLFDQILETKDEIVANTLWKALEIREFLNSKHTHTTWGAALAKALNYPAPMSPQLQEPLLTAFELIRFGHLSGRNYSKSYPGSYVVGNDQEKQHVLLISRTLSLVPMQFKVSEFLLAGSYWMFCLDAALWLLRLCYCKKPHSNNQH
ncbi:temperature dependent protein affecting M2 dsRNA replication-domain-containing protein [Jimgerdemannia flammicorona]|uniref:Temperature dependent protein affecting M2 dsRNA replication-domain-containing protein n=2 Tax=Jimgerdemannia flammicorona TaxID=994334 RepID=A0A432ZZ34_9FUNG|nr:temperature dependent protein affecting M2 dsRNA replication-domain-containing protein [Jimgerdemannia flammicorona]RUS25488.1 temperature dependent protein affecting M2 dsRNA replication-domain-containing protein [Jimgerdemannia flammicorona]